TSVTRSLMIGNVFSGETLISSPAVKVFIRVMHMSPALPLISALHEPHSPAFQFQRTATSAARRAWTRWITSSTTMPSSAATALRAHERGARAGLRDRDQGSEVEGEVPAGIELPVPLDGHPLRATLQLVELRDRLMELGLGADDPDERLHRLLQLGVERVRI